MIAVHRSKKLNGWTWNLEEFNSMNTKKEYGKNIGTNYQSYHFNYNKRTQRQTFIKVRINDLQKVHREN